MIIGGKEVTGKVLSKADLSPKGLVDAYVTDVYDGDTFTMTYYSPDIARFMKDKVRIARINAAEIKKPPKIVETNEQKLDRVGKALRAKNELTEIIGSKEVKLDVTGVEKWGRCLAEVYIKYDVAHPKTKKEEYSEMLGDTKYVKISSYLIGENIVEHYSS